MCHTSVASAYTIGTEMKANLEISIWGIGPMRSSNLPTFVWKKSVAPVEMTVMIAISNNDAPSVLMYVRYSIGQIKDIMKLNVVFRTIRSRKYRFSPRSDINTTDLRLKANILLGDA